ncbi:MAG: hypothetical protein IJO45_01135 [Oscillospiraceae bacterium]|nr:hypothetical protein [Oscillospiraceae bacterium]
MKKIKAVLTAALLILAVLVMAGCSEEATPYQINDSENYSVSVKFDANGGYFGTNTYVIVDAYNISQLKPNSEGDVQIALLEPQNELRGIDAYEAKNPGYFLAGWYAERTETADGYSYSRKWDFEADRLSVDPAETYSAAEPVMTLYAVWVPEFEIEFYDRASGELMEAYTFKPSEAENIKVPAWDEETGAIEMYKFPERDGYTFQAAYYDAEGTKPVDTETVIHPGKVDEATGAAEDPCLKLYLDWTEGEWYRIYNVEQFLDNASVSGNYEILADLDFEGKIWPTSLVYGNFTGSIVGNGHTFKNIAVEQTNNSKVNAGLFGYLAEGAQLSDLTFENVSFTIKSGTRVAGTSFGLLAGTISEKAVFDNVAITGGQLIIDSGCYFGTDDYIIGLLCGMGSAPIDSSDIACTTTGEGLWVSVADGIVTLSDEPVGDPTVPAEETVPEETQEA